MCVTKIRGGEACVLYGGAGAGGNGGDIRLCMCANQPLNKAHCSFSKVGIFRLGAKQAVRR
jgi:hypothetical protein